MGHRPSASEEVQQLRQATREAHEAMRDLLAAIREARALEPGLIAQFEAVHQREIRQLSNYFTEESNQQSANLNAAVERAREIITNQIMSGEATIDRHTSMITIRFGPGKFDDQVPPPYPHATPKEDHQ